MMSHRVTRDVLDTCVFHTIVTSRFVLSSLCSHLLRFLFFVRSASCRLQLPYDTAYLLELLFFHKVFTLVYICQQQHLDIFSLKKLPNLFFCFCKFTSRLRSGGLGWSLENSVRVYDCQGRLWIRDKELGFGQVRDYGVGFRAIGGRVESERRQG